MTRILASTWTRGRALALAFLLAALLAVMGTAGIAHAASTTFTVTNTGDSGAGSLRQAIIDANANAGADTINFNIPASDPNCNSTTGVCTIKPVRGDGPPYFPDITDAVTINGYSQPGASVNTKSLAQGDNAKLLIELDETSMDNDLSIHADGTTVRGLVINGDLLGDRILLNANNVTIEGNFIGVDPTGLIAQPSSVNFGIRQEVQFTATETANNNTIGGATPAARNVISGNPGGGIILVDGAGTVIQGNYIGPNADGTAALTQSTKGMQVNGTDPFGHAVTNTTITGNLISGNDDGGIDMGSGGAIQGNLIGTQRDGSSALGNGNFGGLYLRENDDLAVGGTGSGEGNTIAFNANNGVFVQTHSSKKGILGNSIYSNGESVGGLGISLASGIPLPNDPGDTDSENRAGNLGQNYPVITSASVSGGNATVSGTFNSTPSTTFRLEFFSNEACNTPPPSPSAPNDFGEGQTFIGSTSVTTDGSGDASFGPLSFNSVPAGQSIITSTATDPDNNTSEFSQCLTADGGGSGENTPPVANDDPDTPGDANYTTNEGQTLTVSAANGVLANDTDDDEDTLTVASPRPTSGPSHGTLTLNADGSFTYTPNAGYSGPDSFTYKANDGADDSNTATVTITVNPADTTAPTITGVKPARNAKNVARNTNVTATFSEPMDPNTLSGSTVTLKNTKTGASVPAASVTLSPDGKTVTFDPSMAKLAKKTKYEARIKGGSGGAEDLANNPLAAAEVWSFTTGKK